ncbi:hypothetical protein ARMGADRAFT_1021923 [Armillaria gallica]|uniref:Uncharacterized protein n=1 Tax=Armillaria gallica TaxID=47427 RepID=A0A2H3EXB7_ARMGA|nr:hypothetical protein ARMGADRAFT_1021923 [Armillaria gallica]
MENDDARILAIALGIPSAMFLSAALILAIRFHHRPLQRIEMPHTATVAINPNNSTNNVNAILLEQLPPRIFAPVPWRPIPIDDFARSGIWEEEEIHLESSSPVILERRTPSPAREHTPVITIASPSPPSSEHSLMYTRLAARDGGFGVGRDTKPIAPSTAYDPWAYRNDAPPPQPVSLPMSFGTMSISPSAPTSLPTMSFPATVPPPQPEPGILRHGTSPYKTRSTHPSLYEQLRNPSPAPLPLQSLQGAVVGKIDQALRYNYFHLTAPPVVLSYCSKMEFLWNPPGEPPIRFVSAKQCIPRLQELTAINLKRPHQRIADGSSLRERTNWLTADSHIWLFLNQTG